MNHQPIHQAPANDEAPTTRLRPIADDIDGVDASEESADLPSSPPIDARPVIDLDGDSCYSVGFTETS
jgi:hypothetical protein